MGLFRQRSAKGLESTWLSFAKIKEGMRRTSRINATSEWGVNQRQAAVCPRRRTHASRGNLQLKNGELKNHPEGSRLISGLWADGSIFSRLGGGKHLSNIQK